MKITKLKNLLKKIFLKKIEENKIEENKIEENKIEENKIEENKIEENKIEENKIEENKIEENKIEENKIEENKIEENKIEENKIEENKIEENKIEENKIEDDNREECKIKKKEEIFKDAWGKTLVVETFNGISDSNELNNHMKELLFNSNLDDTFYLETLGFNNDIPLFRNINHLYAKIVFKIFDDLDLDYYVSMGASLGYVRNHKQIPWADDYDTVVLIKEVDKIENVIFPELRKYGFICYNTITIPGRGFVGGYHISSSFTNIFFHVDIFVSKIKKKKIYNIGKWGPYHNKLPENMLYPKKYHTLDGDLKLPFFNDVKKEVKLIYGSKYNDECIFNINHGPKFKIICNYKFIYNEFYNIKQEIINNTKILIGNNDYKNDFVLDNFDIFFQENLKDFNYKNSYHQKVKNIKLYYLDLLIFIAKNNIKNLFINDAKFLLYCIDIKFYFSNINITFNMSHNLEAKYIFLLNYVDKVVCSDNNIIKNIDENNILLIKKPEIIN